MIDTMTATKVVGGFCGTFLIFLLGNWAAESIYHVGGEAHGEELAQAYTIDTGATESAGGEAAEEVPFAEILASADIDKGATVFKKCAACHKVEDGVNGTGPSLYGVVGRAIDSEPGYSYSGALLQVGDTWTPEHLNTFLTNPKKAAPGTKMSFAGLPKVEDRANVIAYLDSLDN